MKVSILHISDLHKEEGDDFKNLYQSMVDDSIRYMHQGIQKPNVIVVSGDLIKGGNPNEIIKQYEEVYAFLNDLVDYFLDGDKKRIVIVPGNHDVDWNVCQDYIKPVPQSTPQEQVDYQKKLKLFLKEKAPKVRWNWNDQSLYAYEDDGIYNMRFQKFADFYERFYTDRHYSLDPNEQYDVFEIPEYNLCFVGLNSCHLNDNLNRTGQINPTCVTRVGNQIKKRQAEGYVLVGVWHHNSSGRPMVNNYLDNRILNPIIDMGVHVALHGHQHYSGVVEEYHNAFKNGKLLMYSTGSLYGAAESLSYGAPRQYNILEMEKVGDDLKLTVHLRQDNNSEEYGIPAWGDGNIKEIAKPSWTTTIPYPKQPMDEVKLSELVEKGMETGNYNDAIEMLKAEMEKNEVVHRMLIDLMMKNKSFRDVIEYIGDPADDESAIQLIKAASELNDRDVIKRVKELQGIKNSVNPQVRKMKDYL